MVRDTWNDPVVLLGCGSLKKVAAAIESHRAKIRKILTSRDSHTHTHLKGICTRSPNECCYGLIVAIHMESTQSICGQPQTVMLPDILALIPLEI